MNEGKPPNFFAEAEQLNKEHEHRKILSTKVFELAGFHIGDTINDNGEKLEISGFLYTPGFSNRPIPVAQVKTLEGADFPCFHQSLMDDIIDENPSDQISNKDINMEEISDLSKEVFEKAGFKIGDRIQCKNNKKETINLKIDSFGVGIRNRRNVLVAHMSSYLSAAENKVKNVEATLIELCRNDINVNKKPAN